MPSTDDRSAAAGGEDIALVHDYLTQRGGAERAVLSMTAAFPTATVHTSLYDPDGTFPEFGSINIQVSTLNRARVLRRHHRLALPLLASTFSRTHIDSKVVLCSSSGWAHGIQTEGRKVVYCYTPARWLYQRERYLGRNARYLPELLTTPLKRWDQRAARSVDRYLVISRVVQKRVKEIYGQDAEILPPPPSLRATDEQHPVDNLDAGFWLCVSRLLPYKNVDRIVEAFANLPKERLVVAGAGPELARLRELSGPNVDFVGVVTDAELCWLYANSRGVLAASYEDFGLTPLEAAVFGRPVAALRWGGFLDTIAEGVNGCFFASPAPSDIQEAVKNLASASWDEAGIRHHGKQFEEGRFIERLRRIVSDELAKL